MSYFRFRVLAALRAAAERLEAERRRAALRAWRDSAEPEAARRPSRRSARETPRDLPRDAFRFPD